MYFDIHSISIGETMKKVTLNIASDKTKKLIENLADLEHVDRQRMSSDGKHYLDEIWKLLGLPKYNDLKKYQDKLEDEEFTDAIKNGTLVEEKQ